MFVNLSQVGAQPVVTGAVFKEVLWATGIGLILAIFWQTVRKRKRGFGVSPAISIYQSAPAS